jgi:hypothetical protein
MARPMPRNLQSKLLGFKVAAKQVETWPIEVVRTSLVCLPDRLRLWHCWRSTVP